MATETQQPTIQKRNDAYTGILAISFLAMTGATVLLYLEYQNYEGKAPPKATPIEVPGAQLRAIPKTGDAPPPPPPKMDDTMPPPAPPKEGAMMRPPQPRETPTPFLLPATVKVDALPAVPVGKPSAAIQPVEAGSEAHQGGVIAIPDVVPTSSVVVPAVVTEPAKPAPRPAGPAPEPNLSDDPPLPAKRFVPPM